MPYGCTSTAGDAKDGLPCCERPSFAARKAVFYDAFCRVLWRSLYVVDFQQVVPYKQVVAD